MDWHRYDEMQDRIAQLEAKVEFLYQHLGITGVTPRPAEDPRLAKIAEVLKKGDYIGAVRLHRELFHSDLVEAKTAVDKLKANPGG